MWAILTDDKAAFILKNIRATLSTLITSKNVLKQFYYNYWKIHISTIFFLSRSCQAVFCWSLHHWCSGQGCCHHGHIPPADHTVHSEGEFLPFNGHIEINFIRSFLRFWNHVFFFPSSMSVWSVQWFKGPIKTAVQSEDAEVPAGQQNEVNDGSHIKTQRNIFTVL